MRRLARRKPLHRPDGFTILSVIVVTVFMVLILIPFWNVITLSFTKSSEYLRSNFLIFPKEPTMDSYRMILGNDRRIGIGYRTTLQILLLGLPVNLLLTVLTSYGLSRPSFPGKRFFLFFVLFTMFFSGGIIPLYLLMKEMSLMNSIWSVILPSAVNTFYMVIMRNYFLSLPPALEEAARIDGAGEFTVLFRVYLPLAAPILATVALFYAVDRWNEWFNAMIFIRNSELTPLQLILRSIVIESQMATDAAKISMGAAQAQAQFALGVKMAAVFVSMVPIMLVYPFLQKYFVKGVLIGAIKA